MMPDDERDFGIDPDEEYPWDCDMGAAGEAETFDLLEDDDD
jgi:hypothetical protein